MFLVVQVFSFVFVTVVTRLTRCRHRASHANRLHGVNCSRSESLQTTNCVRKLATNDSLRSRFSIGSCTRNENWSRINERFSPERGRPSATNWSSSMQQPAWLVLVRMLVAATDYRRWLDLVRHTVSKGRRYYMPAATRRTSLALSRWTSAEEQIFWSRLKIACATVQRCE